MHAEKNRGRLKICSRASYALAVLLSGLIIRIVQWHAKVKVKPEYYKYGKSNCNYCMLIIVSNIWQGSTTSIPDRRRVWQEFKRWKGWNGL